MNRRINEIFLQIVFLFLLAAAFSACSVKHRYWLAKNTFEVKGNFTKNERSSLQSRMANQLDDSAQVKTKQILFIPFPKNPLRYDTAFSGISARNMKASMQHLGYYNSDVKYVADTSGKKVKVTYTLNVNKQTTIDTITYKLQKNEMQQLVEQSWQSKILKPGDPITKAGVLGEIGRLVDTFRNNGYYKFTGGDLRLLGDTSLALLTTISDDPFEQLMLVEQAQRQKDSPKIKLQMQLRKGEDTTRFLPYRIGKIFVLEDYFPGDDIKDTVTIYQQTTRNFIIRYHEKLFRTRLLTRNITLRPGEIYRQRDFNQTMNNLSKAGVWEMVNIQIQERPDSSLLDLVIELVPAKKFGFEAALEGSYSLVSNTSNALAGNLFGVSTNFSLTNRNIGREAIRMTHAVRAGMEFNNTKGPNGSLINSIELSYRNSISIPRLATPFRKLNARNFKASETFVNAGVSYNDRLKLFNIKNFSLGYGWSWNPRKERKYYVRPLNFEYSLFNPSDSFKNVVLQDYPFLRYTYNNATILGMGAGYSSLFRNAHHPKSLSKERSFKFNIEESGLTYGALPILLRNKKTYFKTDIEYKYNVVKRNTAFVFRSFIGLGIPVGKKDTTLPFFKQYFAGGSNSMRAWPARGIGVGGRPLTPYTVNNFNDRTGDMQFETNLEYRYDIAQIIPNSLILRGALFTDIGNIWNFNKTTPQGVADSAQFRLANFYRQLGVNIGTGFRLDFNYFILRADFGFRIKRPEMSNVNNGWKLPDISLGDAFSKLFSGKQEYREWRYHNFNFTIGISYPF